jgi:addiction module HigA family antidote
MSASSEKITQDAAAAERPATDPMSLTRMRRAPTHPGEIFREDYLESSVPDPEPGRRGAQGKQAAAARALGWSANRMNEFVLGKRPLTLEGALDLAELTKTSAEFWATLQLRHDLWHAMQERRQRTKP